MSLRREDAFWSAEVPTEAGFLPVCMEVVGPSSARDSIPARVCVLGKDSMTYKVFALPPEDEIRTR